MIRFLERCKVWTAAKDREPTLKQMHPQPEDTSKVLSMLAEIAQDGVEEPAWIVPKRPPVELEPAHPTEYRFNGIALDTWNRYQQEVWEARKEAHIKRTGKELAENPPKPLEPPTMAERIEHVERMTAQMRDEPPPGELVPLANGLLHLPTGILRGPSPDFFTRSALAFDWVEDASCPRWLAFLEQLWPEPTERDCIEALQLWFGYLLTADTSQEKMLYLIGPPRSGKGTILEAASRIAGGTTAPTLKELSGGFGFESCIGKRLVMVSDMRLDKRRTDTHELVGNLLRLSGQDQVDINRKNKKVLPGVTLKTKVMIASNDGLPVSDSSGALANRFIFLRTHSSFLGREDHGLKAAIGEEAAGILAWAIEGWRKLQKRQRLLQPRAGMAELARMQVMMSPMLAFLGECCVLEPGAFVDKTELQNRLRRWFSDRTGQPCVLTPTKITQDLFGAAAGVRDVKNGKQDGYRGVRLKPVDGSRSDAQEQEQMPF